MLDQTARTQAWVADLAAIIAEIDSNRSPSPRAARRRARKLKPLWEE